MSDHERIWLQHPDDEDESVGRLWCQDKVWPDTPEDGEPTEYVRADLCVEWKVRAEKAEAERDEAEEYANKANAALMETTARAEKAEAALKEQGQAKPVVEYTGHMNSLGEEWNEL